MCQCPRCGTPSVSNKFDNVSFDHVAGGALSARQAGNAPLAGIVSDERRGYPARGF